MTVIQRASIAHILRMPSVDWTEAEGFLVRDVLPGKRKHAGYATVLADMAEHGQSTPIEFRHDPYTNGLMLGQGHHHVAAAEELGLTSLAYFIDSD
jgi:hypothetical protein